MLFRSKDRQTDRHTDTQTHTQTERQTERQTGRQKNRLYLTDLCGGHRTDWNVVIKSSRQVQRLVDFRSCYGSTSNAGERREIWP